ncbi:MAG TPA: class I SAM-dependent methyltransferase [Candidatus Udaeobacter sp.]|nr:class I SAM-dependent methyltransferase [Candidatus Udaeobacter sp.]
MLGKDTAEIIHKTREDYNRIAKHFSVTREYAWPEFKYFSSFIKDGQNILDWGCGNGRMVFCLQGKKVKYYGLDQSSGLIKIARKKFANEVKNGVVNFVCTGSRDKKFPASFFDLVFIIAALFHLPDEQSRLALLQKIHKEMKVGGQLVVMVWNLASDWAKVKAKKSWEKIGENDFLIPWKNPEGEVLAERYYHHFTPQELKNLLVKAGFKVKKLKFMKNGTWTDDKGGQNLIAVAVK